MLQKLSQVLKFVPLIAIGIGGLLVLSFAVRHLPELARSWTTKVEHPTVYRFTIYDGLLKKYVHDGLVDYKSLKADKELQKAVIELEGVSSAKMTDPTERLCYWINALNLLTLKAVCDHYPAKEIQEVSSSFSDQKSVIGGETMSLQQLENRYVLQPIRHDKTIIPECVFLICRGTQGYPPLTDHVITPENLETDAKVATYKFINDERNVHYDGETLHFYLSPLLQRYESIIQKSHKTPHQFVLLYLVTKKPIDLDALMLTKTYFPKMNHTLNDTALAPRKETE